MAKVTRMEDRFTYFMELRRRAKEARDLVPKDSIS